MYVQVGVPASPLVVLQMPPPAAPTQSRQKLLVHTEALSSASAVIRPDTRWVEPVKVKTFGSVAVNELVSPTCCHIGNCGGSGGGTLESIMIATGVGVGVGVAFPFLPPFFFLGVAVGVAVGAGVSVGAGVTVGSGGGVACAKKSCNPACALISAPRSISSGPG